VTPSVGDYQINSSLTQKRPVYGKINP
jgi:hypothetical protein